MKPIRLRMQAFGPYADSAVVDFRNLTNGGLFLIHGQTGAGKTSILDGLCFSLFGRSSGSERAPENLRCDRAPAALATEVQLEFALGNRVYKSIRRPRQIVKKQRGEGLTSTPAKGELFESLDSSLPLDEMEWTLVASGEKKTDDRITELLGMNEEQFRQVVVLPQGQFRKFLSSTSDDREELLETLFRTEKYRELTERLQARASLMVQDINSKRQLIQTQLSMTGCEDLAALDATILELSERLMSNAGSETEIETKYKEALERRDTARIFDRNRLEFEIFKSRAEKLETQKPEIDQIRIRLDNERRARPVLALDSQNRIVIAQIADLDLKKSTETQTLGAAEKQLIDKQKTKSDLSARQPEIEAKQVERSQLQGIYTDAKNLGALSTERKQAETSLALANQKLAAESENLVKAKANRESKTVEIEKRSNVTQVLSQRKLQLEKTKTNLIWIDRGLKEFESARSRLERTTEQFQILDREHERTLTNVRQLKLKFHLSQAAQLAHLLKPNEECPVCGSLDHPKPAEAASESPTPDQIDKAEHDLRKIGGELSAAKARRESIDEELKKSSETLASHLNISAGVADGGVNVHAQAQLALQKLSGESESLKGEIQTLEREEKILLENRQLLETFEKQIKQAEFTSETLRKTRDESQRAFEKISQQITSLEERVPEKYRELDVITKRGMSLKQEIETFQKTFESIDRELESANATVVRAQANIKTFTEQLATSRENSQKLDRETNQLLEKENFGALTEVRAFALTPDNARQLEQTKKVFDDDWITVHSRVQSLQSQLSAAPPWASNLKEIEESYATVDRERRERSTLLGELKAKLDSLTSISNKTKKIESDLVQNEEKYKVLGKLAAVAGGQPPHNLTRVNFQRYVLAARLDEVLDQASRRLFLMSRGQFTLRRSKSADDKRKNAGLDLEVEDSFTGTSRPTSSLSGGEGFLASLSLALGLADVVQSQLGGVRLDAVFVDEGFGTLDGEALELAIKTLSELQAGGRIVGIISHVPELREQIAHRLHVRKTAVGSAVGWENAST